LQSVHDGKDDPHLTFFSDEARFYLHGHVFSQNNRCWSSLNSNLIHEVPLHEVKVGMRCAMNAKLITGCIFYMETINSDGYVRLVLTKFFAQLTEEE
jgi:hypothetical protein